MPIVIGLIFGYGWVIVTGVFMTISGIADYEITNMLRDRKSEELVVAHPKEIGCAIVGNIEE